MQLNPTSGLSRIIPLVVATLGFGAAAAFAAPVPNVTVALTGKVFGTGQNLHATSGSALLTASKAYNYTIQGTCAGSGSFTPFVPSGTPISTFIDKIRPGTSRLLSGIIDNPSPTGSLPMQILNKTIKGTKTINGVDVVISMKLGVNILSDGLVNVNITNVTVTPSVYTGSIKFEKGTNLQISAAPELQFKGQFSSFSETDQFAEVVVYRYGSSKGVATVKYDVMPGTATAGDDYLVPSTQLVEFADKQVQSTIKIPLVKNATKQGQRKFSLMLHDPGTGAVLGTFLTHTVTIRADVN